ncbi:MAG: hypothetical protein L0241_30910 [Planctomycetia bacterium]|nr:hypothetical protein [Planctomycetia bacterium]
MKVTAFVLFAALACALLAAPKREDALPPLPDKEGFAGMFAGVSDGKLIAAGGANFPNKKPWEGGTKKWYDTIFVLDRPDGKWQAEGKLPRKLGYGVSVQLETGVLCAGGSDAQKHYPDCFLLERADGKVTTRKLPALPKSCAYAGGARVGDAVFIAGGIESPSSTRALKTFWSLDLKKLAAGWKELEAWPGAGAFCRWWERTRASSIYSVARNSPRARTASPCGSIFETRMLTRPARGGRNSRTYRALRSQRQARLPSSEASCCW